MVRAIRRAYSSGPGNAVLPSNAFEYRVKSAGKGVMARGGRWQRKAGDGGPTIKGTPAALQIGCSCWPSSNSRRVPPTAPPRSNASCCHRPRPRPPAPPALHFAAWAVSKMAGGGNRVRRVRSDWQRRRPHGVVLTVLQPELDAAGPAADRRGHLASQGACCE